MKTEVRLRRLEAMLDCLKQMLKGYPTARQVAMGESRFLCHRIFHTSAHEVTREDVRSVIRRALQGYSTFEDWYQHTHKRRVFPSQKLTLRKRWLRKLIKDCKAEIEVERGKSQHGSSN